MTIKAKCDCGRVYAVADDLAGRQAKCKVCGKVIKIAEVSSPNPERQQRPWRGTSDDFDNLVQSVLDDSPTIPLSAGTSVRSPTAPEFSGSEIETTGAAIGAKSETTFATPARTAAPGAHQTLSPVRLPDCNATSRTPTEQPKTRLSSLIDRFYHYLSRSASYAVYDVETRQGTVAKVNVAIIRAQLLRGELNREIRIRAAQGDVQKWKRIRRGAWGHSTV